MALCYWPFRSPVESIAGNTSHSRRIDFGRLALSLMLSATAFVLRPTNLTFWAVMGTELVVRIGRRDLLAGVKVIALAVFVG